TAIVLNHSATHLLHAALRKVLGPHVQQKGSLVAPTRLRFDFSHYEPVTPEQLREIEALVNAEIRHNAAAEIREIPYDEAIAGGPGRARARERQRSAAARRCRPGESEPRRRLRKSCAARRARPYARARAASVAPQARERQRPRHLARDEGRQRRQGSRGAHRW